MEVLTDTSRESLIRAVEEHQSELAVRWTRAQGGEVQDDADLIVAIAGLPVSYTNSVLRARLDAGAAEERIAGVVEILRERRIPGTWSVGPRSRPDNLADLLVQQGFQHVEDMPWMAADLDEWHPASMPKGVAAHRVDGPERQAQWLEAMRVGFALGEPEQRSMSGLADAVGFDEDAMWQRFVALKGDDVVASSGVMFGGGVAGIYNVSTRPWARGQGIGSAMSSLAMDHAWERGYRIAVLGSQPRAVPMYIRLGFQNVVRMGVYVFEP